jgi:hypothetical protein
MKMRVEHWWKDIDRGHARPSANLNTTKPTRNHLGLNPGICGERPATDAVSHGGAFLIMGINLNHF